MKRIAFIGAGNMAYAIIGGMKNTEVTVYDKLTAQYDKFDESIKKASSASEAVSEAEYIVLSVKPQNFPELLNELREGNIKIDNKVFISIAAGISCDSICRGLGKNVAVVRTMPNTPLLIGRGVTALSRNSLVPDKEFEEVNEIFSALGKTLILPEDKMNAVIAATSSAPAYVYKFIDAIYKEARTEGIDSPELLSAICAMVSGSAEMIIATHKTPDELIRMVTSPNGTTERAMKVLDQECFSDTVSKAMKACTERAEELSQSY